MPMLLPLYPDRDDALLHEARLLALEGADNPFEMLRKRAQPEQKENAEPKPNTPAPQEQPKEKPSFDWLLRERNKEKPLPRQEEKEPTPAPAVPPEDSQVRRRFDAAQARTRNLEQIYRQRRSGSPAEWDAYWQTFSGRIADLQRFWQLSEIERGTALAHLEETLHLYEEQMREPAPQKPEEQSKIPVSWRVHVDPPALNRWLAEIRAHPGMPLSSPTWVAEQLAKEHVPFKQNGNMILVMIDGYEWQVSRVRGGLLETSYVLQASVNPQVKAHIEPSAFGSGTHLLSVLRAYAHASIRRYESEQRDAAGMKHFELAGQEPLGYVEIADLSNDLMRESVKGTALFAQALATRYNVVTPQGGSVIDGSSGALAPHAALHARIQQLHDVGVRNFYVNIQAHGLPSGFGFGANRLYPSEVTNLFAHFSDSRFTLNTIACYGGGMHETFARYADYTTAPQGRVTVITQTKVDTTNWAPRYGTEEKRSTAYQAVLADALVNGDTNGRRLTFGEAHLLADRTARDRGHTDAGALRSNPGALPHQTAEEQKKHRPAPERPEGERGIV